MPFSMASLHFTFSFRVLKLGKNFQSQHPDGVGPTSLARWSSKLLREHQNSQKVTRGTGFVLSRTPELCRLLGPC